MNALLRAAGLRFLSWLANIPPDRPEPLQSSLDSLPVESAPCCTRCPLHREWLFYDAHGHVVLPRQRLPLAAIQFYFGIITPRYDQGRA